MIPYSRQSIDQKDIYHVSKSMRENIVTQGKYLKKLETDLAKKLKCKYVIACSSATAGLHLVNSLFKNKKFLTSPLTFVATVSTIIMSKNKFELVDISKNDLLLDPTKIKNSNFDGIINVLFSGCSSNSIYLRKKFKKKIIIEDASHALGAYYEDGTPIGSCKYSDFTIFSLHPVKSITAGEGGIITTNSKIYYEKLKLLRSHGILRKFDLSLHNKFKKKNNNTLRPWYYEVNQIGFNYRINEFQCALAISQLKKLKKFIKQRKKIALFYDKFFCKNSFLEIPQSSEKQRKYSSHHLYTLRVKSKIKKNRDFLQKQLQNSNIGSQIHYIPIYKFQAFKKFIKKKFFPNTEYHFSRCLSIPIFYNLKVKQQKKICSIINKNLK